MTAQQEGMPDVWSVYLAVDDAEKTVELATTNGGQVFVEPMAVGDLGTMAVVADAGGAMIGMWQPGEHRGGVVGTGGAPCHFELFTRDYDRSVQFYKDVFGWQPDTAGDEPGFRYTVLARRRRGERGDHRRLRLAPRGRPRPLVGVLRGRRRRCHARQGEGARRGDHRAGEDTPYGRLATASDSTGALFKLHTAIR